MSQESEVAKYFDKFNVVTVKEDITVNAITVTNMKNARSCTSTYQNLKRKDFGHSTNT